MYKVDKKPYGFHLTFADAIDAEEMRKWLNECKSALTSAPKEFGVFIDMRTLKPLTNEARLTMEEGQKLFKTKGMQRSVVILSSSITKIQFKNIAKETGIYAFERYIDSSSEPAWEKKGVDWLTKELDPDK